MKMALVVSPESLKKKANCEATKHIQYIHFGRSIFIIDTNLFKEDYIKIQRAAKARGANIYPSYNSIAAIKNFHYSYNITVTKTKSTRSLQEFIDLTVHRLCQVQSEVMLRHLPSEVTELDIGYKGDLGGGGGHSMYKQNFQNIPQYSNSNIIISTMVPLEKSALHQVRS